MASGGVATANIFDLLDDSGEEAPEPAPALAEPKKPLNQAAVVPKSGGAPAAAQVGKPSGVEARLGVGRAGDGEQGRGRGGGRGGRDGGRGGGRGGRGRDGGREGRSNGPNGPTENGLEADDGSGRGRGRGGGGPNRGRSGRGDDRRRFDRYDQTGRSHETEKRHGAGKGNWGTEEDDITAQGKPAAEAEATPEAATPEEAPTPPAAEGRDWDAAADPEPEAEAKPAAEGDSYAEAATPTEEQKLEEPVPPMEPEKPQISLGEWEALQKEKRQAKPAKTPAASKEDFSNMTAFTRKDRTAGEEVLSISKVKSIKDPRERERKMKEVVETGFRIDDGGAGGAGGRGRGGFGGRGGGRDSFRGGREGGFGGRGERDGGRGEGYRSERPPSFRGGRGGPPRGGRGMNGSAPQIDDTSAFPGLG